MRLKRLATGCFQPACGCVLPGEPPAEESGSGRRKLVAVAAGAGAAAGEPQPAEAAEGSRAFSASKWVTKGTEDAGLLSDYQDTIKAVGPGRRSSSLHSSSTTTATATDAITWHQGLDAADATSTAGPSAATSAAACAARAELACMLAPLLHPSRRTSVATGANIERLLVAVHQVAGRADGRTLLDILASCSRLARLGPDMRAATLHAAAALLTEASTRVQAATGSGGGSSSSSSAGKSGLLPLERRVSRSAALSMHSIADEGWRWRALPGDCQAVARDKQAGMLAMRSLRNYFFSDLRGWSSIT